MSKLASKLSKRIMAAALSVAMVMSNMTVYADELGSAQVKETADESVAASDESAVTPDGAEVTGDESDGDEVTGAVNDETEDEDAKAPETGGDEVTEPDIEDGTEDESLEKVEEVKDEEEIVDETAIEPADEPDYSVDYNADSSVDVWDFGAAYTAASGEDVNGMLTTEALATFKADLADSGKTEAKIEVALNENDATAKDTLTVVKKDSENIAITDSQNIAADTDDPYAGENKYTAYLTIPANTETGKESGYITLSAKKGDTITLVAYAAAKPAVTFAPVTEEPAPAPSENITTFSGETTHVIRLFAADADFPTGTDSVTYKIASTGNLAIARIYRGKAVTLSGAVTGLDAGAAGAKLTFTPADSSAAAVDAAITTTGGASSYEAVLKNGLEYTVSIDGYDVQVGSGTDADDKVVITKDTTSAVALTDKNVTPGTKTDKTFTFDAAALKAAGYAAGSAIFPSGTLLGTDLYFKINTKTVADPTGATPPLSDAVGSVPFVNKSSTDLVELSKWGSSGIEFTVADGGTASLTLKVASTGSNNYSVFAVQKGNDFVMPDTVSATDVLNISDGKIKVKTTDQKEIKYSNLSAGKYTLLCPYIEGATNDTNNRGGRVISLEVVENAVHADRAGFETVSAPEVKSAVQVEGESDVDVAVNALVGYDGGDKVTVSIEDAEGAAVASGISGLEGSAQTVTLSLKDKPSGEYTAKAELSRGTNKKPSTVNMSFNFVLPLAAPTLRLANNSTKENVAATLSWAAVKEATGYIVKVTDKEPENGSNAEVYTRNLSNSDANADGGFSIDFDKTVLALDKTYTFSVTALREGQAGTDPEQSEPATRDLKITALDDDEGGDPVTYKFDATTLSKDLAGGDGKPIESIADYFDGYFAINGTVNQRLKSDGTATTSVELLPPAAAADSAIVFTTKRLSNVTVEMSSTGGSNTSDISLKDADGTDIEDSTGEVAPEQYGTSRKAISYQRLPKGTYYLYNKGNNARNTRVYTITVTEGVSTERKAWDSVAAPVIKGVAEVFNEKESRTELEVTVTADISDDGGDKLTVNMYDAEEKSVGHASTEDKGTEHKISIVPKASGDYTFKAAHERTGVNDIHESAVYPAEGSYHFKLPLVVPLIKGVTNKGAVDPEKQYGSVELSWNAVPEATSYIVKAVDKAAAASAEPAYEDDIAAPASFVKITEGLLIGHTYTFSVAAKRTGTGVDGADEITETDTTELQIKDEDKRLWSFSAYGDSTSTKPEENGYTDAEQVGYEGKTIENPKDVRVWSEGAAGKIVPASVDGLAFYYTTVDPTVKNFTFSAIAHVNSFEVSNAQDGFGIMAADRVGKHGYSGKVWNNSYQALASKVEYRWNPYSEAADYSTNTEYPKYSMKLGIGTTEKKGVNTTNLPELESTETVVDATKRYFRSTTKTLETYCGEKGLDAGTYNVIGGYNGSAPEGTVSEESALVTDLLLSIQLNNTGYYLSYTPITVQKDEDGKIKRDDNGNVLYTATGETVTNKHYDRDALSKIEEDTVYVGVFASRNADVTFMNIELDDSEAYDPNGEVEQQPIETVDPAYGFTSGTTANEADYDLLFAANWQGYVTVKDSAGNIIVGYDNAPMGSYDDPENGVIEKLEEYKIRSGRILDSQDSQTKEYLRIYDPIKVSVELGLGTTTFSYTFVPDPIAADNPDDAYNPDPNLDYNAETNPNVPKGFKMLSDYSAASGTITVTYKRYGESGEALYVSPTGTALGNGTQRNPLDIYTAVKYVQAGQTIYLMDGTYNLTKTVTIDRGINGTEANRIYMLSANPATRPVFNFNRQCEGIVLAGDWWYVKGFDVTRSANAKDGMRISGSHNVIEQVHAYNNGNTGIQISRYTGSDTWDYWPSYNLVLNCTSYLNSDQGFEDADGFTAKLTVAEGNVFDGCIAAYNADDGWDLFAKVESGNIGRVVVKNSIAYKNGYVLIKDPDGDGVISSTEIKAADRELVLDGIETRAGNGNGFKMGGSNLPDKAGANGTRGWGTGHTIENCLAFYNGAKGFDSNSCPNIKVKNSVTYNNLGANVAFYGTASNTDFAADGLISYRTEDSKYSKMLTIGENIQPLGIQLKNDTDTGMKAFYNAKSYYWNYSEKVYPENNGSYQIDAATTAERVASKDDEWKNWTDARPEKGYVAWLSGSGDTKVTDDWFVKVGKTEFEAFDAAFRANPDWARKADNTIDTHGFLMLDETKAATGGSLGGADHEEQGKLPTISDDVKETGGNISKGDAPDETSGGVATEDMEKFIELNGTIKDTSDIMGLWFNIVEDVYYTGKAVKPLVHVYSGTTQLTKKDYSITYKNNVNAYVADPEAEDYDKVPYEELKTKKKVPTIIVTGKGNYVGKVEATFDIHPVSLSADSKLLNRVGAADLSLAATGKDLKVKPVVTFGTKKLSDSKKKDYEVLGIYKLADPAANTPVDPDAPDTPATHDDETGRTKVTSVKDKGSYEIDIKGHGNFTGERSIALRVYDKSAIDNDHLVSKFKVEKIEPQYREVYSISNYTGAITEAKRLEPTLTVKNSKGAVVEEFETDADGKVTKVNYTRTYKNNVEIGTASVIITGVGDYYGTKEVKFRIVAPRINQMEKLGELKIVDTKQVESDTTDETTGKRTVIYKEFTNRTNTYKFEGEAVQPSIGVQLKDGTLLAEGYDYTLTFKNNNKAGMASAVIKGKGNYSAAITKTFKIEVFDLADAKNRGAIGGTFKFDTATDEDGNTTYIDQYADTLSVAAEKGNNRPEVTLTIKGFTMKKGRDYTVTYKNPTFAAQSKGKKPQVIITGKGALKGKLTKDFTITKKNLNQAVITAQDVKISSKKGDAVTGTISPRIILQDSNRKKLSAGADYDKNITYVLLDDAGNESGTSTHKASITDNKRITINKYTDVVTVRAKVKASTTNKNAFYTGETYVDFKVGYAKRSLNSAKFEINYNNGRFKYFNYTGKDIILGADDIKVYFDRNEPLVLHKDYEILQYTYKNNNKKGTASVTIYGKGDYAGTKVVTFRIGAQNMAWWTAKEPEQKPEENPKDTEQ